MIYESEKHSRLGEVGQRSFWRAETVAIIGASDNPNRIGGRSIAYMLERKFGGRILPVNPNRDMVQGLPCYESIEALPLVPDIAIVAVADIRVPLVIEALGRLGVGMAVVFSSGFAETGSQGHELQQKITHIARQYGIRILGPNTLGFFDIRHGLYATFSSAFEVNWPLPGCIAIASQSGAFAAHIFSSARKRGIGIPLCITTGNESDISIGEAIAYMVEDSDIRVIGVYLEGLSNVDSFISALQLAKDRRKPIVLMKTGRSEVGQAAAQSHTASIAGDDKVFDAVLREFAVVRVTNPDEFLDIAYVASKGIYPTQNTLGVLSISGGAGILISDLADDVGLHMPEMPLECQARLRGILPFAGVQNPVDCTAQVINQPEIVQQFSAAMIETGLYSSFLGFFTQAGGVPSIEAELRPRLAKVRKENKDRLFVLSIIATDDVIARYERDGFCVFEDPARAVKAIHAMGVYGEALIKVNRAISACEDRYALPEGLDESQAKQLLATIGFRSVPEQIATSANMALEVAKSIGLPVVIKILSPDIRHKSDIGGVILNVDSEAKVLSAYEILLQRAAEKAPLARIAGVLVSKQIEGAIECIMGINRDPTFGPVAMFGLGGIFVEIMQDVVLRRCPFDAQTAKEMILSIRGASLLLGVRGRQAVDINDLAETFSRLSILAVEAGDSLVSLEINPILALPASGGNFIADALIEVKKEQALCA